MAFSNVVGNRRFVRRIACSSVRIPPVILAAWLESLAETAMIVLVALPCVPEVLMFQSSISGVVPPSVAEATIMMTWPSVASTGLGKSLGRLYRIKEGFGPVSIGRLALLATIPVGLVLYLSLRLPWAIKRYRLTNRRVAIEVGINPRVVQYVALDNFDAIDVAVSPGQEWFAAGDLIFRRGQIETLRLPGVSRPESFRRACLNAHLAYVSVAKVQPEPIGAV